MTLPTIFATYPAGNVPASLLDGDFNAVGAMGVTQCTAAGTNAITLTPKANQPAIASYVDLQLFSFEAVGTSTGAVTIQVGALAALPLYLLGGTVQANANNLVSSNYVYLIAFNNNINGFELLAVTGQEGSWTPVLAGTTTPGSQTYAANGQVGRYIRVDNLVQVWFSIVLTAKDGATAGNMEITGLPFSASSITSFNFASVDWFSNITLAANYTNLSLQIPTGASTIFLWETGSGQAAAQTAASEISNTTAIHGSITYRIN